MNIHDLVTQYVDFRRTLGEKCKTNEAILRSFCRAVGPQTRVTRVRVRQVATFLAGTGPISSNWHAKYSALNGFFQFAVSHAYLDKAPLPTQLPKRPPTLVPYIYSPAELRRLLDAIPSCLRIPQRLEPPTMRAMLLAMYGAGLRRQEVLDLALADVDLPQALLTIRNTKFFKSRLVPIGRDLTQVLSGYARWRAETHPAAGVDSRFFLGRDGTPIGWWTLYHAFQRLRKCAGVQRSDGGRYQPRLQDLRHSFAVHRLTAWYRQGSDVQRLVYPLSVYLGHAHLTETQVYLTMTPELLQQAGRRFERYARGEDHHA
ncbi:MAG: tyrosine-type recombinase/integrase [Candidatus Anammoximicrobium sp.]|mgnify:CR=1 FL=1|nr:tyrosine-type recombinase/integrase [Candidatus Anammoximicrobium sp.]